jgi:hypothetical protein
MPDGRRDHGGDVLLAPRLHHHVRQAILQLRGQHRAVPVEVVRFLAQLTLIDRRTDVADIPAKLLDERLTCHFDLGKRELAGHAFV